MRQQQELHLQSMNMMQDKNILAMQMLAANSPTADQLRKLRDKDQVPTIHWPYLGLPQMGSRVPDQEGAERTLLSSSHPVCDYRNL